LGSAKIVGRKNAIAGANWGFTASGLQISRSWMPLSVSVIRRTVLASAHQIYYVLMHAYHDYSGRRCRRIAQALGQAPGWLDCEPTWIPAPTERQRELLSSLLAGSGIQANLVPDAHLAALAIEHGLILCWTDGDFARFRNLRWQNPLSA